MRLSEERLTYFAIIGTVVGIACLLVNWLGSPELPVLVVSLAGNIGSFLLATVVLGWIFTYYVNRDLMKEVVGKTRAVDLVTRVRLLELSTTFHGRIDWDAFITGTKTLDVFVVYARTWRQGNMDYLRQMLKAPGSSLRVLLPDYRNADVMSALAHRFHGNSVEWAGRVRDAGEAFLSLAEEEGAVGSVQVVLVPNAPVVSFYIAESSAVLSGFTHRPNHSVLTAHAASGGELYQYIVEERDALLDLEGKTEISEPGTLPAA
jgi:hypothetical protein